MRSRTRRLAAIVCLASRLNDGPAAKSSPQDKPVSKRLKSSPGILGSGAVAAARCLLPLKRRERIPPDNQPSQVREWCDVDFHRCNSLKLQKPEANNLLPEPLLLVAGNYRTCVLLRYLKGPPMIEICQISLLLSRLLESSLQF